MRASQTVVADVVESADFYKTIMMHSASRTMMALSSLDPPFVRVRRTLVHTAVRHAHLKNNSPPLKDYLDRRSSKSKSPRVGRAREFQLRAFNMGPLPKPAEILHVDCRNKLKLAKPAPDRPIKMLQWNIERGYKLEAIIEELKRLDADVIALQEIDIGCERSNNEDTGMRIAQALELNYAFLCEFEELRSPLRDASTQGGGVHGNAILSKFDMRDLSVVEHTVHPVDWENPKHPLAVKEPRHGRRLTLVATVDTSQGPLMLYTAHLECFCGMLARMHQLSDILRHAREHASSVSHQAILGDLNTLANGVARLSPWYCSDWMRWWTLGWFEAEVWDQVIWKWKEDPKEPNKSNPWAARAGLPDQVCRQLVNPGFEDPFDVRKDVTMDLPKYRLFGFHLMTGKLDWLLLRNMKVESKSMGNDEYDKSDHKWLMADVHLTAPAL